MFCYTENMPYVFQIMSVVIPIVILFSAKPALHRMGVKKPSFDFVLWSACVLFFVSWYIPSPLIYGQDTSFTTHFLGGGIFTGFLWLYIKLNFKWSATWFIEAGSLFALVSSLGVLNELFEFTTNMLGLTHILLTDTSWDLVANTLGDV